MKEKTITISDVGMSDSKDKSRAAAKVTQGESRKKEAEMTPSKGSSSKKDLKSVLLEKKGLIFGILFTVIGISMGGTLIYSVIAYRPIETSKLINHDEGYLKIGETADSIKRYYSLPEPSEPRNKINPLNGILMTNSDFVDISDRRPVAVMVNNHAAARPQTNLSKADIVYEALVESGITRYMPVYWQNAVIEVGPIRSARQYYLEWLSEYDAIYIHDGYASSDDPRVDAGGNIWRYGIKSISTQGAWRDPSRVAPHNEYSSVANAMNIGKQKDWTGLPSGFRPWTFKNDAAKEDRGQINEVSVVFHERLLNSGLYNVTWEYDRNSNSFKRYIAGSPDIDAGTDKQIRAKTVILQEVVYIPTFDEKAHIIIETQGEGNVTILIDGKAIEGTWKKDSRTERTVFYDSDKNELPLNRGLIWVTAVAKDVGAFDIIEQ